MSNLDRRDGYISRAHALEPVPMVFLAFVKMDLLWPDNAGNYFGITRGESLRVFQFCNRIAGRDLFITS